MESFLQHICRQSFWETASVHPRGCRDAMGSVCKQRHHRRSQRVLRWISCREQPRELNFKFNWNNRQTHVFQILTAASCLLNNNFEVINPFWFKVIAGDVFFSQESVRRVERGVSRIFIHPQFNSFTGENNIAVLRVSASNWHWTLHWLLNRWTVGPTTANTS